MGHLAHEALLAHVEHLRSAVAHAPIVLFAVDVAGVFTLSEGQGLEALGIRPGEHVGRSYFELYGDLPDSVAVMRRALAGEPAVTVERFRGLVFETRWMPAFAADGTITGVIGVSADVTARAQAEAERDALLQREQQARAEAAARAATLDATFGAIADGVLVYDRDGRLVHANAAARTAHSWNAQPGYGDLPFDARVHHALPRDAEGRILAREEWPVSRVLRGEVLTGALAVDTLVRRPDGQDVLLSVSGAPIRDAEGQITGGVIVDRDVTERRRLEQRTREALDALLEMAQVVVETRAATEGPDEEVSRAMGHRLVTLTRRVLGCARVSLVTLEPGSTVQRTLAVVGLSPEQERAWWELVDGRPFIDPHALNGSALAARIKAGEVMVLELTHPRLRDRTAPFGARNAVVAPLCVGDECVGLLSYDYGAAEHEYTTDELTLAAGVARFAALAIERDRLVHDREEARASALALRESNRRMDEFLGIASHELRTPLTGLRASLQLVQRRLERAAGGGDGALTPDPAGVAGRLAPFLERALHQSSVLAGLVDDLLDLSRIQAGRLQLRLAPCDLVALVRQAVEERSLLDPTRTITLEMLPLSLQVQADMARLVQVVDHYLDNALKYSAEEQPVIAGIAVDGTTARVWVRDMGPGISPAEQERIWDRFYRPAGTEHRSGSSVGLGLGLYISRTIVERHGGRVGVESAPGGGATFWFSLPLAASTTAGSAPVAEWGV